MEISAKKTKLMTNSSSGIQREIKIKGQKLGTVTRFKYLEAIVSDGGSKPEVLSRIAQATAALTKLKPIWRDNNISLGSKVKLMRFLVISIFLHVRLWVMDLDGRAREKDAGLWDEKLPKITEHLIQGPCHQWGCSQKDQSSHWKIWRTRNGN